MNLFHLSLRSLFIKCNIYPPFKTNGLISINFFSTSTATTTVNAVLNKYMHTVRIQAISARKYRKHIILLAATGPQWAQRVLFMQFQPCAHLIKLDNLLLLNFISLPSHRSQLWKCKYVLDCNHKEICIGRRIIPRELNKRWNTKRKSSLSTRLLFILDLSGFAVANVVTFVFFFYSLNRYHQFK